MLLCLCLLSIIGSCISAHSVPNSEPTVIAVSSSDDATTVQNHRRFEPNWPSLDARPLPAWYDRAKVGIFIHWGVYAVPTIGTEWFWTNWRTTGVPSYVDFMQHNYPPQFTYQQFAPQFTGELFNATEWAALFRDAGAQYVVLTSKHHDGFAMWPSQYSFSWNAGDIGLHRDVVGELASAVRHERLTFGLYHSLFEWYHPLYVRDREAGFNTTDFVRTKVLPEMRELIERYAPSVLWSDGDWEPGPEYWNATDFLAWLYNDSPVRQDVVTNDRWGSGTLCRHGDFYTCSDRYNPGVLQAHKWENAMTIDRRSWGHRTSAKLADYVTGAELIAELVITVSCGGNILVNVGPNRAGTIEPIFEERLRDMGEWLRTNGEAIYESKPWRFQNDTLTKGVWYTTKNEEASGRTVVYATVLEYPYNAGGIGLYSMIGVAHPKMQITMLGYPKALMV